MHWAQQRNIAMTTTKHNPHKQIGRANIPATKEEQLEVFAQKIVDDLREYWNYYKLPLPWYHTKCKQRPFYAPLATMEELKAYTIQRHLTELKSLDNKNIYVPKDIELTSEERTKLIWEYQRMRDRMNDGKKGSY
jgi:hypothetical protein